MDIYLSASNKPSSRQISHLNTKYKIIKHVVANNKRTQKKNIYLETIAQEKFEQQRLNKNMLR